MVLVDILVLFLPDFCRKSFQVFTVEYDVSCGLVYGLYYIEICFLYAHFIEFFFFLNHKWKLDFFFLFAISWATPVAYGGPQARGPIEVVVTGLRQSHSNARSEPRL